MFNILEICARIKTTKCRDPNVQLSQKRIIAPAPVILFAWEK